MLQTPLTQIEASTNHASPACPHGPPTSDSARNCETREVDAAPPARVEVHGGLTATGVQDHGHHAGVIRPSVGAGGRFGHGRKVLGRCPSGITASRRVSAARPDVNNAATVGGAFSANS